MKCKKCSVCIDSHVDLYTVCEGDCAGFFHADCVDLKEGDFDILSRSQNILWICDVCMSAFRRLRDGISSNKNSTLADDTERKTIEDDVNELKNAVKGILNTLSNIAPNASTIAPNVLHSTPVSSYTLFDGKNGNETIAGNDESVHRQRERTTNDDCFALFLSNIDPSATERDIHRMVSCALGTAEPDRLDVIKLTRNTNMRMIDYVSFKVVVSSKWKNRALDPSTWPVKIKFREFVCDTLSGFVC